MAGNKVAFSELPYFFSDQFDLNINAYGDLAQHTQILRRGALEAQNGFFQFYFNKNILEGVLSINRKWKEVKKAKDLVEQHAKFDDPVSLTDETKPLETFLK